MNVRYPLSLEEARRLYEQIREANPWLPEHVAVDNMTPRVDQSRSPRSAWP